MGEVRLIAQKVGLSILTHTIRVLPLDDFSTRVCFTWADPSTLTAISKAVTSQGKKCWSITFSTEIHFGLTEFKVRIKWDDDMFFFIIWISATRPNTHSLSGESEIVSSRPAQTSPV